MPPPDPQTTERYLARTEALAAAGGLAVARVWDDLGSWNESDIARLESSARPGWEVFAQQAAAVSSAYLAVLFDEPPVAATALTDPDWRGPFTHFWGALGHGEHLEQALAAGRARAEAAGHKAVTSTARRVGSLFDDRVSGWRRTLSGDSCEWCITVAGQTYQTADSADFGHDRCVVGSTLVASAAPARQVTRRWHSGEVVVIGTASGDRLTITPNHPVLTPTGWVAAGRLDEGDDLVRCVGLDRAPAVVPDEHHVPTSVEERFGAHAVRGLVRVPFASQHFHRDRGDGEVDVVAADWQFWDGGHPSIDQQFHENALTIGLPAIRRSRLCGLHQLALAGRLPSHRGMGSSRLGSTLVRAHPRCPSLGRGPYSPYGDVLVEQMSAHRPTVDSKRAGDRQLALAGEVSSDRITELRRVSLGCHVFNLVTEDGWYSANNIVVHNCNCGVIPILT